MRYLLKYLLIFISILFLILSCQNDDPCIAVNCQNDGTCQDGDCICPNGCSGNNCETKESTKYVGTWTGPVICSNGASSNGVLTLINSEIDCISLAGNLSNTGGADLDLMVSASNNNSLNINVTNSTTLTASANFNEDGTITLVTIVDTGNSNGICTYTFSK